MLRDRLAGKPGAGIREIEHQAKPRNVWIVTPSLQAISHSYETLCRETFCCSHCYTVLRDGDLYRGKSLACLATPILPIPYDGETANEIREQLHLRDVILVGSDVLMSLYYGLAPEARGLLEQEDLPVFTFPPDYLPRLRGAIETVDPEFAEDYQACKSALKN